jgi:hypothetical protein
VTDLFERLVAASGLPPIRLHDLQHGATTLMLTVGRDRALQQVIASAGLFRGI